MGKTKKQLEQIVLKKRQYRSSQGRTPEQLRTSAKISFFSMIGIILILGYLVLMNNLNL